MSRKFVICFLVVAAVAVYGFLVFSLSLGVTVSALWTRLLSEMYKPNQNIFIPPVIKGMNFMLLFYEIVSVCSLIVLFTEKKFLAFREKETFFNSILFVTLSLFVIVTVVQTWGQAAFWRNNIRFFGGKSLDQRSRDLYGHPYLFARECRAALPGRHVAQVISDIDFGRDEHMATHRLLAYFLYPIDIRGIQDGEVDCLIYYKKKNAGQVVPKGFRVLKQMSEDYLLAVSIQHDNR